MLGAVLALLVLYLLCPELRTYLKVHDIDPNFIIGFSTVIALFLSLIQASSDKRYAYNLELIKSIEDKGLVVISKLITINNKSLIYIGTVQIVKSILGTNKIYKDTNDTLSKTDVERDMELVATYIDTFFPAMKENWNNLTERLSDLGTICSNIILNYNENHHLLGTVGFSNDALNNIDTSLKRADELNQEIKAITLEIRDSIVMKINASKGEFKKSFGFTF
jgi:hypothetical protein